MVVIAVILFVILLAMEMPIAFGMGTATAIAVASNGKLPMILVVQRMVAGMDSFVLLAVPFFILAGALMDTGGISARLVRLCQALVGHIRGGLGMVVVLAEYLFSGLSGSTVADVSAIGAVVVPLMKKSGYPPATTVSIISSASAVGILVPPCIPMIVLGGMTNLSVASLFAAGFLPAAVMALLLMLLIYMDGRRLGLPAGARPSCGEIGTALKESILPLGMPVVIFGGILGGIMTATEAGAVAVAYAAIVGVVVYREIPLSKIPHVLIDSGVTTGAVMFLVGTASVLAWIMASEKVPEAIAGSLLNFSRDPLVFMVLTIGIFAFFSGFLEGLPALVIFVPILYPISKQLGIDPIHYGIVLVGALGIGLFIPPVGVGLFIACGIAKVTLDQVLKPFSVYLAVMFLGLFLIAAFPWITLALPRAFNLGQ